LAALAGPMSHLQQRDLAALSVDRACGGPALLPTVLHHGLAAPRRHVGADRHRKGRGPLARVLDDNGARSPRNRHRLGLVEVVPGDSLGGYASGGRSLRRLRLRRPAVTNGSSGISRATRPENRPSPAAETADPAGCPRWTGGGEMMKRHRFPMLVTQGTEGDLEVLIHHRDDQDLLAQQFCPCVLRPIRRVVAELR
jgi:hypothetical protein